MCGKIPQENSTEATEQKCQVRETKAIESTSIAMLTEGLCRSQSLGLL